MIDLVWRNGILRIRKSKEDEAEEKKVAGDKPKIGRPKKVKDEPKPEPPKAEEPKQN